MSRTNHHISFSRGNRRARELYYLKFWSPGYNRGELLENWFAYGNETWDLRFYAGCKRVPQVIHRVVDTRGTGYYCHRLWLEPGLVKRYGKIREREFRAQTRRYVNETRLTWNAGGDVEEITEPDVKTGDIWWRVW
jgi:hypothetical protein